MPLLDPAQVLDRAKIVFDQLRTLRPWEMSLNAATIDPRVYFVTSLYAAPLTDYAIVATTDGAGITARFALDSNTGVFLEGQGVRSQGGHLTPWVDPHAIAGTWGVPVSTPEIVWQPCRESASRFKPFWRYQVGGSQKYVRSDGYVFDTLTTDTQG
jgi:hypothetical protein